MSWSSEIVSLKSNEDVMMRLIEGLTNCATIVAIAPLIYTLF